MLMVINVNQLSLNQLHKFAVENNLLDCSIKTLVTTLSEKKVSHFKGTMNIDDDIRILNEFVEDREAELGEFGIKGAIDEITSTLKTEKDPAQIEILKAKIKELEAESAEIQLSLEPVKIGLVEISQMLRKLFVEEKDIGKKTLIYTKEIPELISKYLNLPQVQEFIRKEESRKKLNENWKPDLSKALENELERNKEHFKKVYKKDINLQEIYYPTRPKYFRRSKSKYKIGVHGDEESCVSIGMDMEDLLKDYACISSSLLNRYDIDIEADENELVKQITLFSTILKYDLPGGSVLHKKSEICKGIEQRPVVIKVGTPGHISIAIYFPFVHQLEYWDSSYKKVNKFYYNMILNTITKAVQENLGPVNRTIIMNDTFLQKGVGTIKDLYCQTWIWLYAYYRIIKQLPPIILQDILKAMSNNERFDFITMFSHEVKIKKPPFINTDNMLMTKLKSLRKHKTNLHIYTDTETGRKMVFGTNFFINNRNIIVGKLVGDEEQPLDELDKSICIQKGWKCESPRTSPKKASPKKAVEPVRTSPKKMSSEKAVEPVRTSPKKMSSEKAVEPVRTSPKKPVLVYFDTDYKKWIIKGTSYIVNGIKNRIITSKLVGGVEQPLDETDLAICKENGWKVSAVM